MSEERSARRIAVVADHFHPVQLPAEARINTEVVARLVARGERVDLFCTEGAELTGAMAGVALHQQPPGWGRRDVFRLAKAIARGDYDDIVVMYDAGNFGQGAWVTLLPPLLRKWYRVRGQITVHFTNAVRTRFSAHFVRGLRGLNRLGFRLIDGSIGGLCCGDRLAFYCDAHRSVLLRNQAHLLARAVTSPAPLTVDLHPLPTELPSDLRNKLGFDPKRPLIVFFGLVYPLKGIEFLLHAVEMLNQGGERVQVAIIGEHGGISGDENWRHTCREYWEEMQRLTGVLGLEEQVRWAGHIEEAELPAWLAAADLACFPFTIGIRANNSSFSVCAAYGLPVVTTDGENVDGIFREPENGVRLVPSRRADLLARTIGELLSEPDRLKRMKQEILTFYRRYFRWDAFVDSLSSP